MFRMSCHDVGYVSIIEFSVVENPNNFKLMHTRYSYEGIVKSGWSYDAHDFEFGIIDNGSFWTCRINIHSKWLYTGCVSS